MVHSRKKKKVFVKARKLFSQKLGVRLQKKKKKRKIKIFPRTIHENLKRYSIITAEFKVSHELDKLVEVNVDNGCHGDGGGGGGAKSDEESLFLLPAWSSSDDTVQGTPGSGP